MRPLRARTRATRASNRLRKPSIGLTGMACSLALILTKPIGTGTLLAADMRRKAKARWVMAAITHMIQSNGRAADILRWHGVHAATDVTGFGLLGHLVEMVRASDVDVTIAIEPHPAARSTSFAPTIIADKSASTLASSP